MMAEASGWVRHKTFWKPGAGFLEAVPDECRGFQVVPIRHEGQYEDLVCRDLCIPLRWGGESYWRLVEQYPDRDKGPDGIYFSRNMRILFMEAKRGSTWIGRRELLNRLFQWHALVSAGPFDEILARFDDFCRLCHGVPLKERFREMSGTTMLAQPDFFTGDVYPTAEIRFAVAFMSRDLRSTPSEATLGDLEDTPLVPRRFLEEEATDLPPLKLVGYQAYRGANGEDLVEIEEFTHEASCADEFSLRKRLAKLADQDRKVMEEKSRRRAGQRRIPEEHFTRSDHAGLARRGLVDAFQEAYLFLRALRDWDEVAFGKSEKRPYVSMWDESFAAALRGADSGFTVYVGSDTLEQVGMDRVRPVSARILGREHPFCAVVGKAELAQDVPVARIGSKQEAKEMLPAVKRLLDEFSAMAG